MMYNKKSIIALAFICAVSLSKPAYGFWPFTNGAINEARNRRTTTYESVVHQEYKHMIDRLYPTVNAIEIKKRVSNGNKDTSSQLYKNIYNNLAKTGFLGLGEKSVDDDDLKNYFAQNIETFKEVVQNVFNDKAKYDKWLKDHFEKQNQRREDAEVERDKTSRAHFDKLDGAEINLAETQDNIAAYRDGAVGLAIALGVSMYGVKFLYTYFKESMMKPPFCNKTNDEGAFASLKHLFWGAPELDYDVRNDLFFNHEQQKMIDNLKVDYLKAMEYNLPCPHFLFYGPHGTGKTSLALRLAGETDSIYYILDAQRLLEKDGPRNFRQLMRRIEQQGSRPIVFIDEADALIGHSSSMKGHRLDVFNQILSELGGTNNRKCTFIFTTNLPDRIDKRILDRLEKVQFVNPDIATRQKVIASKLQFYFEEDTGGLAAEIDHSEITPDIIAIAAEKTKDWSCRGYDKFVESLRRHLVNQDEFTCRAQDFLNHIEMINARNRADAIAQVNLRDQYSDKR